MINPIDKILTEWAYRVHNGMPDPKNSYHLVKLDEAMSSLKLPRKLKQRVLTRLQQEADKVYFQGKAPEGAKVQTGPRGGKYYVGDKSTGQPEGGPAIKKKKPSKSQKKAEQHVTQYNIENNIQNAKTPQDEMNFVGSVVDAENQHILDGNYGPGGGAASYGEFNYSEASNDFFTGKVSNFGEKPSKPVPNQDYIDHYNKGNQTTKRTAYAQELGIDPYNDNDPTQRALVVTELARRETWVDEQVAKHDNSKVKKQKFNKTKADRESQREWLRVGFDGGRSTMEDLHNDPDYGGVSDNPDHPKPKSMIMSPANQKAVKTLLEKKFQECKFKSGKVKKKCEEHYQDQLDNFDEGLEDHDTGTVYYDVDGNLRFLNTSNKKSKSMKDPHNNSTAQSRIPEVIESMDEIADSGEYPGMDEWGEKKAASIIARAQEKATRISVDAAENVMQGKDENGKQTLKIKTKTNPADSGGLGVVAKSLPAQKDYQRESGYFDKAAGHKKTVAKLEELYGTPPKEGYTDEQKLVAIMAVTEEDGSWDPHGKFVSKMGQMYNKVEGRFGELKSQYPDYTDEQIYEMLSVETEQEDGSGRLYTPEDLLNIRQSDNLKKVGQLNNNYKGAMDRAHNEVVSSAKEADEVYMQDNPGEVKEGENGPHVRGYVKSWMKGMHWDKYIENLDGKKNIQIGGINCKPADFRKCLAKQAGLEEEPKPRPNKVWRKQLQEHLEKNIKIDADSNAVNLKSKKSGEVKSLGEDTWRSAGDAKKIASGIGDDMIGCIKESVSGRKKAQRSKP